MYEVFKRTATDFKSFSSACKYHICFESTEAAARETCRQCNENRSAAQRLAGTKYEFRKER